MIRIGLPFIFNLHGNLDPLSRLEFKKVPKKDVMVTLVRAQFSLHTLIKNSVYSAYLRTSFALGNDLLLMLENETNPEKLDADMNEWASWAIKEKYNEYRIALLSELGTLPSFFVTQKAAFDSTMLLNWGEALFPADLGPKVQEAVFDAKEAAKCIAFEVPTAAAFHVFRVVEAVLRRYYAHVTNGAALPKVRSIKIYVRALAKSGDPKILSCLEQMAELHRNPLIHPEAAITLDEAISIAGIGRSAVTAMLGALPMPVPTTSTVGALSFLTEATPQSS